MDLRKLAVATAGVILGRPGPLSVVRLIVGNNDGARQRGGARGADQFCGDSWTTGWQPLHSVFFAAGGEADYYRAKISNHRRAHRECSRWIFHFVTSGCRG